MNSFSTIKSTVERQIATITIARPKVLNALNVILIKELTEVFSQLKLNANEDIRLVVLQGEGNSFCAGIDIKDMQIKVRHKTTDFQSIVKQLTKMYNTIKHCYKPVIGKVHGHVIGGGFGLCTVCDFVIAAENSRFSLPEVLIGIVPSAIGDITIQKIGKTRFLSLGLSGESIGPEKAIEIGLINRIVRLEDLRLVSSLEKQLLKAAPKAVKQFKQYCHGIQKFNPEKLTADSWVSAEGQEGLNAFLEQRVPDWVIEP